MVEHCPSQVLLSSHSPFPSWRVWWRIHLPPLEHVARCFSHITIDYIGRYQGERLNRPSDKLRAAQSYPTSLSLHRESSSSTRKVSKVFPSPFLDNANNVHVVCNVRLSVSTITVDSTGDRLRVANA